MNNLDQPISYTADRKHFFHLLKNISLVTKKFSSRSLRSGGAAATVKSGVSDRLFKIHRRRKSEKV